MRAKMVNERLARLFGASERAMVARYGVPCWGRAAKLSLAASSSGRKY